MAPITVFIPSILLIASITPFSCLSVVSDFLPPARFMFTSLPSTLKRKASKDRLLLGLCLGGIIFTSVSEPKVSLMYFINSFEFILLLLLTL